MPYLNCRLMTAAANQMKPKATARPTAPQPAISTDTSAVTILSGYIEPQQLAKELGISERTLARWHTMRVGPPRVTIGRRPLYKRSSVAAWIERQEIDSAITRDQRRIDRPRRAGRPDPNQATPMIAELSDEYYTQFGRRNPRSCVR